MPAFTVGEPGAQGVVVAGTHGAGVKTPIAAEVAAITAGLEGALHMPNGFTLTIGALSIMVATGILLALTCLDGITVKGDGATPKVHCNIAPCVTVVGILSS